MARSRLARVEEAMRVVLQFHEALNRHDVPGMMAWMSEDCRFENTWPAPDGTLYAGKEEVAAFWQRFFAGSPGAHIEVEECFGLGERCVLRWRYRWVDADGQPGHVRGVDLFRVRQGLIHEKLSYVKG